MDTLFASPTLDRVLRRIDTLRQDSRRAWGTMDTAQISAHCANALEAATGDRVLRRNFAVKIIGPFFRGWLLGPKPFSRNSPTHPELVFTTPHDFERERSRLVAVLRKFHAAGPASAGRYEHAFVGKLSGEQWGVLQYKHLDHHLRQFGAN